MPRLARDGVKNIDPDYERCLDCGCHFPKKGVVGGFYFEIDL